MMAVAKFSKVTAQQFTGACAGLFPDGTDFSEVYQAIRLPRRATAGSAGYDFFAPFDFTLAPGEEITIPSGIRAKMDPGCVLMIFPRSGLGFRYRLTLNNTVGIIDSDYYHSDNEGHIMIRMTNCSPDKTVTVEAGKGFAQGIFLPFGLTEDDDATGLRNGGFGSTTK